MRAFLVLIAVTGVLALTGCVPDEPMPTLPPTPSAEPVFESEEEALAAAEEAYAAYQRSVDVALQTGDPSGLETVAIGDALDLARQSVHEFAATGKRQEGGSSVVVVFPADIAQLVDGAGNTGQIYACLDLSAVRVINSDGSTSNSTQPVIPMLVTLFVVEGRLLVQQDEVWDGADFCA